MDANLANRIDVAISRWAAWAPGMDAPADWGEWAAGRRAVADQGAPDVTFVPPMMRRRLSLPSRMAFRVANDCLDGVDGDPPPQHVFCSRYGEYDRTFGILTDLADGEPASALAFSMSVHNTAASLFAIDREDRAVSTSVAAGAATLETAFVDAWGLLETGEAGSVLLVYADAPLPEIYREDASSIGHPIAIAFLLKSADTVDGASRRLTLGWRERADDAPAPDRGQGPDPALAVLRLVMADVDGGGVTTDDGRLIWEWRAAHADA